MSEYYRLKITVTKDGEHTAYCRAMKKYFSADNQNELWAQIQDDLNVNTHHRRKGYWVASFDKEKQTEDPE